MATKPTFNQAAVLAAMQKPVDEWTAAEAEAMLQYEAYEAQRAEQIKAQRQAEQAHAQALRDEGAKRSRQYWQRIRDLEQSERERNIDWFMHQMHTSRPAVSPVRLNNPPEHIPQFLTEAYRHEVIRRGQSLQLDLFTQRAIADTARWLTTHTKPGLMLRGYVGVGKTTLLLAIASLFRILNRQTLKVVDARRIAALAKDNPKEFEALTTTPLLGIDDLGTEPQTVKHYGNELSPVAELLTERYNRQLFTIITTNLTLKPTDNGQTVDELQQLYGDRLFDRFHEMFNTIAYDASQKSYRK